MKKTILFVFWAKISCSLNTINLWVSSKCHHFLTVCPQSDFRSVFSSSVARWEEFKLARFPYLKGPFNGLNWGCSRLHRKGVDANLQPKGFRKIVPAQWEKKWHFNQVRWTEPLEDGPVSHPLFPAVQPNLFLPWVSQLCSLNELKSQRRYVGREINSVFVLFYEARDNDVMWSKQCHLSSLFPQILFYVFQ